MSAGVYIECPDCTFLLWEGKSVTHNCSHSKTITALRLALETATQEHAAHVERMEQERDESDRRQSDTLELTNVLLDKAERERDDFVEKLKAAHKREDGYRIERDEARVETKRLMSLTQNWYEGRARIGSHMTFVDQRFYDSVRLQRTGWPGDDANGDGGPPEE